MNLDYLGNNISHIHEYLIPRRTGDKNAGRSPWPIIPGQKLSDEEYQYIAKEISIRLH